MEEILSVTTYAHELGRSEQYVRALIRNKLIKVQKLNRAYVISRTEADRVKADMPVMSRAEYKPLESRQ